MYQRPFPVPVPIPLPIPVPIFVPTTRNSTRGVKKFLKKMKAKLPANVFEAQILEMAGALDDKNDPLDSDDSEWEGGPDPDRPASAQSSLSTSSLRELMTELGSRLGRPWATFGQALLDRLRGGHRLGRSGSGRSEPGRGRARRRQL